MMMEFPPKDAIFRGISSTLRLFEFQELLATSYIHIDAFKRTLSDDLRLFEYDLTRTVRRLQRGPNGEYVEKRNVLTVTQFFWCTQFSSAYQVEKQVSSPYGLVHVFAKRKATTTNNGSNV